MAIINGGSVTFGRSVKVADYENKKSEVTLTFGVPDGASDDTAEEILGNVAERARNKALELVGLAPAPQAAAGHTVAASVVEAPKRGRPPKPPVAAAGAPSALADAGARAEAASVGELFPPASSDDPLDLGSPAPVEEDIFSGVAAEITDAELHDSITKRNNLVKNSRAIRELIGRYAPAPPHANRIPQEKRAAFLVELAKVTAP